MKLIPKRDLNLDGWTYGEWTQYVAFLGDDSAQCCRRAQLPTLLSMLGCFLFAIVLLCRVFFGPFGTAGWFLLWTAGAMQSLIAVEILTGSLWMRMLGPVCPRMDDGGFYRLFPGEE